jgi:NAD/NADP transhydrogenase beta subunit
MITINVVENIVLAIIVGMIAFCFSFSAFILLSNLNISFPKTDYPFNNIISTFIAIIIKVFFLLVSLCVVGNLIMLVTKEW